MQLIEQALRHHQEGDLTRADFLYRQVLSIDPNNSDALHLLGVLCFQKGALEEAIDLIRRAIQQVGDVADFHCNLGNVYKEMGRTGEACAAYEHALQLAPDHLDARYNLALALQMQGRLEEAAACYRQVLEVMPYDPAALNNLGNTLKALGQSAEAEACYRTLLRAQPGNADAYANLGVLLQQQGKLDEAIACYRNALNRDPGHLSATSNLGLALANQGALAEAEQHLAELAQARPDDAAALSNLAVVLYRQGRLTEALQAYQRALSLQPSPGVYDDMLFVLNRDDSATPEQIAAVHRQWGALFGVPPAAIAPHRNDRSPDRRLRIGYVSPDFHSHSVAFFIEPVLAAHDRQAVEVYCYANVQQPDAVTERLKGHADHWIDCVPLDDAAMAERVRADRIDILVDLAGHSAGNRLPVFARKPAPVQVTWLGYPNTTGLSAIDYRITDAYADPPGMTEGLNVEQLVRLPQSFSCYQPPAESPEVAELPARRRGQVTFGSFNRFDKLNPSLLALWARVLGAVPGARLLLKAAAFDSDLLRNRVRAAFVQHGLAPERVEFLSRDPDVRSHLARYGEVDIALDTYPYHGTTTTCEALWMGVPTITLAGVSHVSRVGCSQLTQLGLPDLIAESPEDYVAIAARLSGRLDDLATLRCKLRARMQGSPLMDRTGFTRALEAAYRQMWHAWARRPGPVWRMF